MNLSAQAKQTQEGMVEECDAGLVKIVAPIFIKDEFLGAIGACGFLLDGGEVDSFLVNMTTGIDEEEVERLSADIETISIGKARIILSFIEEEISKITRKFEKK
jgi:ligand-binding sensor protein